METIQRRYLMRIVPLDKHKWDRLLKRVDALSVELKKRTRQSLVISHAAVKILDRELDKMIDPDKK